MSTVSVTKATAPKKKARAAAKATDAPAPGGLVDLKSAQRAAMLLRNCGDATRVRVLLLLADEPRDVGGICALLGQSQPACSHHLAICRHGGIVDCVRSGKQNIYELTAKGRMLAEVIGVAMAEDAGR